jgi:hypothetical protein
MAVGFALILAGSLLATRAGVDRGAPRRSVAAPGTREELAPGACTLESG